MCNMYVIRKFIFYLRPTLHSDGTHSVQTLTYIPTLSTQLHHAPLEILELKQIYLIGQ